MTFDGDFESANVDQVRQKTITQYDVWMRNDSNGVGNLQWFYFRMKNTSDFMETIRISLVNFTKGNSLFHSVSPSIDSEDAEMFYRLALFLCTGNETFCMVG